MQLIASEAHNTKAFFYLFITGDEKWDLYDNPNRDAVQLRQVHTPKKRFYVFASVFARSFFFWSAENFTNCECRPLQETIGSNKSIFNSKVPSHWRQKIRYTAKLYSVRRTLGKNREPSYFIYSGHYNIYKRQKIEYFDNVHLQIFCSKTNRFLSYRHWKFTHQMANSCW